MRKATILIALLVAACGEPELHVQSDTSWTAYLEREDDSGITTGTTVDGQGDQVFELNGGHANCWRVTKTTADGRLRTYVEWPAIAGRGDHADATTTAKYGAVSGCIGTRRPPPGPSRDQSPAP